MKLTLPVRELSITVQYLMFSCDSFVGWVFVKNYNVVKVYLCVCAGHMFTFQIIMSLIMNDDQDNHHILMTLVWALFLLTQSEKKLYIIS